MAKALVSLREGPRSHTLDTIPETQDLDVDYDKTVTSVPVCVPVCHSLLGLGVLNYH